MASPGVARVFRDWLVRGVPASRRRLRTAVRLRRRHNVAARQWPAPRRTRLVGLYVAGARRRRCARTTGDGCAALLAGDRRRTRGIQQAAERGFFWWAPSAAANGGGDARCVPSRRRGRCRSRGDPRDHFEAERPFGRTAAAVGHCRDRPRGSARADLDERAARRSGEDRRRRDAAVGGWRRRRPVTASLEALARTGRQCVGGTSSGRSMLHSQSRHVE